MTTQAPQDIYPFATQDGQAIPLDILRPDGVLSRAFNASTPASITWNFAQYKLAALYATQDCLLSFDGNNVTWAENTLFPKAVFIPARVFVIASLLSSPATVVGISASGTLHMQFLGKWAGLALERQYTKK